MSNPTKLPWMKFYPADWRSEASLRVCSLAARGLWMEMLALMHDAGGSLLLNGQRMTSRQLASLSGASVEEVDGLIEELKLAGVFSVDGDGTLYSRRIRRDIAKSNEDKANGKKGGNPRLKAESDSLDNRGDNPPVKAQRLEARGQNPEVNPSPPAPRDADAEKSLEAECRAIAANMPVAVDPNFIPVLKLLDENLLPDDILAGMRAIRNKNHALRNWHGVGSWARTAAKDRIERAMPAANYARAGPDGRQPTARSQNPRGQQNGTPKSPSDVIREIQQRRAEQAKRGDQELLA